MLGGAPLLIAGQDISAYAAVGLRFLLGFTFLFAAIPKLAAPADFQRAVQNYALLPNRLAAAVARWLPRMEISSAILVLLGLVVVPVAAAMSLLLFVFCVAIVVNLFRGRQIDCGCAASVSPRRIGWRLVLIDLLLAASGIFIAVEGNRALTLDGLIFGRPPGTMASSQAGALVMIAALLVSTRSVMVARLEVGALLDRQTFVGGA